jgi:hypothetical protein
LTPADLKIISSNTRLCDVYNYRLWWKEDDPDTYLIFANNSDTTIQAGEQVFYSYGNRANSYLFSK